MEKDNQFIKVLDILEKEYGWGNMGALEKMQAELINDTIKATRMVVNKNFVKLYVRGSLPLSQLGDFVDWIRDIKFKKYREGWCQEGGSNGWHCSTDELMKMFNERDNVR